MPREVISLYFAIDSDTSSILPNELEKAREVSADFANFRYMRSTGFLHHNEFLMLMDFTAGEKLNVKFYLGSPQYIGPRGFGIFFFLVVCVCILLYYLWPRKKK